MSTVSSIHVHAYNHYNQQRARPHCPAVIPADARDLILRLVRKRPQDRLGASEHKGMAMQHTHK